MILVFVTQVSSVPLERCSMTETGVSSHTMIGMADHEMEPMDCCGEQCKCSIDMCISTVFIMPDIDRMLTINNNSTYRFSNILFTNQKQINTIFYPPILS
jgi:hypothetical protein